MDDPYETLVLTGIRCNLCGGSGHVERDTGMENALMGTPYVYVESCSRCNGTGLLARLLMPLSRFMTKEEEQA